MAHPPWMTVTRFSPANWPREFVTVHSPSQKSNWRYCGDEHAAGGDRRPEIGDEGCGTGSATKSTAARAVPSGLGMVHSRRVVRTRHAPGSGARAYARPAGTPA